MPSPLTEAVKAVAPLLRTAERQVLQALLFAPQYGASAAQLRILLGFAAVIQVNSAIGRIGRKVHDALGGVHPEALAAGEYEWWHVIATGQFEKNRGFVWQLRNDVVIGLLTCGYSASGSALPDEIPGSDKLYEGIGRQVTVNAYERNPVARTRCIEAHGSSCCVCGFDFGAIYGPAAAGFVHVHHITPLALIGTRYEVDPVQDLRPVCPNCHAVIHMVHPPRSIEEVKKMLLKDKASSFSSP